MDESLERLQEDIDLLKEDDNTFMQVNKSPEWYRKVLNRYMKQKQENPKLCKGCGICCKQAPCHYAPIDFNNGKITYGILKKEIDKGYISIIAEPKEEKVGLFEDKYTYFLRVRGKNRPVADIAVSVPCSMLTDTGCKFSYKKRPTGGKMLIPRGDSEKRTCFLVYTIYLCREDWMPYQKILGRLFRIYRKKPI